MVPGDVLQQDRWCDDIYFRGFIPLIILAFRLFLLAYEIMNCCFFGKARGYFDYISAFSYFVSFWAPDSITILAFTISIFGAVSTSILSLYRPHWSYPFFRNFLLHWLVATCSRSSVLIAVGSLGLVSKILFMYLLQAFVVSWNLLFPWPNLKNPWTIVAIVRLVSVPSTFFHLFPSFQEPLYRLFFREHPKVTVKARRLPYLGCYSDL